MFELSIVALVVVLVLAINTIISQRQTIATIISTLNEAKASIDAKDHQLVWPTQAMYESCVAMDATLSKLHRADFPDGSSYWTNGHDAGVAYVDGYWMLWDTQRRIWEAASSMDALVTHVHSVAPNKAAQPNSNGHNNGNGHKQQQQPKQQKQKKQGVPAEPPGWWSSR